MKMLASGLYDRETIKFWGTPKASGTKLMVKIISGCVNSVGYGNNLEDDRSNDLEMGNRRAKC